jgi:hypothetical protein
VQCKGKITPRMRARAIELARSGLTSRQVSAALKSEGLALSHISVQALCREAGVDLGPSGGRRRRADGEPARSGPTLASIDAAVPDDPEERLEADQRLVDALMSAQRPDLPPLDDDAPAETVAAWEQLSMTRQIVMAKVPSLMSGDYSATQWVALARLEITCQEHLAKLRPPAPPDPAKDPTNIAARESTHATVLSTVDTLWSDLGLDEWVARRARGGE